MLFNRPISNTIPNQPSSSIFSMVNKLLKSDNSSLYMVFGEVEKMKECMIILKKTYLPEKYVVLQTKI